MKTITKIKESSKAVAGPALLVGATLAGGAAFATAQDSGSSGDLGDYPAPFIDDDGNIASTIVMGEDAKATDVVAATEIAGQLGNDAFSEETQTVSTSGASGTWSATNGQSLDTTNDQLYFGSPIDDVRDTLTEDQLDMLQTTEAFSGDQDQEVEQYLYVGNQNVGFGQPGDLDDEDPQLFVNVPDTVETDNENNYLYKLQANFEDGVEFTDSSNTDDSYRNDDVYGEEVSMFGMDFTVSDDSFQGSNAGQLVLYGSQDTTSVASGESTTITIDGEEHTIEVVGVTGSDTAAVRIDGDLEQYSENDEETLSGQTVRIDNIIQTNADNSQGVVQVAMGSEQIILEDGSEVMLGEDEEDVDGTQVALEASGSDVGGNNDVELSSVEVAFGAPDNDETYVTADETFENEVFSDLVFRFGGLNPDSADAEAEGVSPVEYGTDSDDTATVSIEDGEDSADIPFVYDADVESSGLTSGGDGGLQPDEGDDFVVTEGAEIEEDDYFVSDAGDFAHVWEVTNIDRDTDENGGTNSLSSDDEATIDLEDVVTGASVEVDLDTDSDDEDYVGTEVIDGQTYNFFLDGDSAGDNSDSADGVGNLNGGFHVSWDSGASVADDGETFDLGERVSVYSAVDTGSDAAVAFTKPVSGPGSIANGNSVTLEMPSTDSTDARTLTASVSDDGNDETLTLSNSAGSSATLTGTADGTSGTALVTVGNVDYVVEYSGLDDPGSGSVSIDNIGVADNQRTGNAFGDTSDIDSDSSFSGQTLGPASITIQPEDDNDREHAFIVEPVNDDGDDEELDVGGGEANHLYTADSTSDLFQDLESDDDEQVGYTAYGTYVHRDTDEPGTVSLNVPSGQSTAGAAFTNDAGELSSEGGGGSGSVDTMMPTGWPAQSVALDSDDFVPEARTSSNLILVGGPAANSLVEELANNNKTWSTSDYTEGEGLLQLVPEAFNEDHDALVVAGYTGEDTRQAGEFLSNYEQNSEALAGQSQVSISTAEGSVVQ